MWAQQAAEAAVKPAALREPEQMQIQNRTYLSSIERDIDPEAVSCLSGWASTRVHTTTFDGAVSLLVASKRAYGGSTDRSAAVPLPRELCGVELITWAGSMPRAPRDCPLPRPGSLS